MMRKGFHLLSGILFVITVLNVNLQAQSSGGSNYLYGPPKKYKPIPLVKRLSYENFRNIKLLTAAIINFGGGEAEIDKLIDNYAEASALYFQNKYEDSAEKFLANEKEILAMAKKLARQYFETSDRLLKESIKLNIKKDLKSALKGEKDDRQARKFLNNARFAVQRGNDIYVRFKDASVASPRELITAIYYYRRAKANMFIMHDLQLDEESKKKFKEKYKKDMMDNRNRVYKSKEKQN
jgi:hypothetical protein